jgi:Transposase DDE domain
MKVIEATQPGVDTEARWVKKVGKSVFGYKQHTAVDDNDLVMAVETTAANRHDSQPMPGRCWIRLESSRIAGAPRRQDLWQSETSRSSESTGHQKRQSGALV